MFSLNMSKETLAFLSSLDNKPGLAFYTAYAHVKDIALHLSTINASVSMLDDDTSQTQRKSTSGTTKDSNLKNDKCMLALPTLVSCVLSSQELLLGLLYRSEVGDFRPGVDKVGIGLLVGEIVGSFASLLHVATGLSREEESFSTVVHENPSQLISESPSTTTVQVGSFLPRLADAASLGLLSTSSKSALRSVLALFDDCAHHFVNMREETKVLNSISQLRNVLDMTTSTRTNESSGSSTVLPYHQLACAIPQTLLKSHQRDDGSIKQSSHGPEDYMFQIPHVILELYFWYVENALFPQIQLDESGGGNSEVLILVGTIIDVCAKIIGILDLMLLADFHPLRISVHGSSGFYSQAFHRIRAWFSQAFRAASSRMNLDQLHLCPELFVEETLYLQRLDRASASFRALSFGHYVLAQRIIGSDSMGSAGKSFEMMQSTFLPHPNPKSNAAKHRMHEYTNVKYTSFIGLGTQAVEDSAKASVIHAFDLDDSIRYDDIEEKTEEKDGDGAIYPESKEILVALERSFVKADAEAFLNLFDTDNCCVEHPPGTHTYVGTTVKGYFLNMQKRHPVFRSFKCVYGDGENITIDVDADLFEGTAVQYQIQGECILDESRTRIIRLILDGLPDVSKELCQRKDQRLFAWTSDVHKNTKPRRAYSLRETFRRPMAPAEILAYELNKNKSGTNVSDGLTIVARSMVGGALPMDDVVQDVLDQIARRNNLLTAHTEVTVDGHYFVVDNDAREINLRIIEGAVCRFDCDPYLNTQLNCDKGDMIRVIISKLGTLADPSFELVTIIFHGICDAISVQDLHSQIIHRMSLFVTNAEHSGRISVLNEKPLPRAIAPPTTHYAREALAKRTSPATEPLPLPEPAPIHVPVVHSRETAEKDKQLPKSMSITRKFSATDTKVFLAACKRNNTTAHAAIGAASLMSANCGESTNRVLTSAVDLRRRLDIPKSELIYSVGGFDGSAAFEYDMNDYKKSNGFWKLCHSIRKDLVHSIDSGRLLTTYMSSVEGLVEAYKAGFLDGGTFGTIFLSNIGNESYQKSMGPFKWLGFDYKYGQFLPGGAHYHITCSTFDGCLTLNFQHVSPTIPENAAIAFVESTIGTLMDNSLKATNHIYGWDGQFCI